MSEGRVLRDGMLAVGVEGTVVLNGGQTVGRKGRTERDRTRHNRCGCTPTTATTGAGSTLQSVGVFVVDTPVRRHASRQQVVDTGSLSGPRETRSPPESLTSVAVVETGVCRYRPSRQSLIPYTGRLCAVLVFGRTLGLFLLCHPPKLSEYPSVTCPEPLTDPRLPLSPLSLPQNPGFHRGHPQRHKVGHDVWVPGRCLEPSPHPSPTPLLLPGPRDGCVTQTPR